MSEAIPVLVTVPFSDEVMNRINTVSPLLQVSQVKARRVDDVAADTWAQVQILYTNRIIPSAEQAPRLRWMQFHWAGIDHALDAPLLRSPTIQATTLSGAACTQVAEYILMMLLSLGHRLPDIFAHQRKIEWALDRWERFSPRELRGATVGIVGYGSIGRQVARLLIPFGATVLATKNDARHPQDLGYTQPGFGDPNGDFVHRLYPAEALRSMLKECDFVVVTVPLTRRSRGMIGAEEFAALKPHALLVDASRGGVIDQAALIAALKEKRLAGYAGDVFPIEPLPEDNPLWKMANTIISPHIAGNSPQYDHWAAELFIENLQRFLAGMPLYNLINLNLGY